ncbi:extracellular catalytic domain type 1 short-chain-length polyhydroxyalkanoate depolymerase [Microvirga subterranea]|uniref:Poly(Hydroxyalkanoate) depolymerase family esterase n=1 Tax=Microvirga subterranea TaxID=186651 RepID=A0A370HUH6_9HYPH|nr:PHB depolymerase family esterase [Microvirga subterranea]RDI62157.1 poly(hydroxyalkanoate) depolymerase family esterase [Microvirga subterranea]
MNSPFKTAMAEVTRLTRAGRLSDAMAAIRNALSGKEATAPQPGDSPAGQKASVIDLQPPRAADGSWTAPDQEAPRESDRQAEAGASWTGLPHGLAPAGMPEALRDFLGRIGEPGTLPGLDRGPNQAPAPLPEGARFEERVFANAAGRRAYKLYVPARSTGEPLPLVVMLHGCTQSPDDFAAGTRMNELAEEEGFLVAYPAQTKSANVQKCWNWFNVSDQQRDQGEPALIAGITRAIMEEFPVAPGRVYVAGLSAGGAAAAVMGATYPDLYAAVGVHSGLACGAARDVASAFAAMRQGGAPARHAGRTVPTIVFHGDGDKTVHPVNGDHVIAQSKAASDLRATVDRGQSPGGVSYTRTVQTDENGHPMLEQWVLHGAGHAWSGGSPAGSYTDPRGPDASREMLRFFQAHPAVRPPQH